MNQQILKQVSQVNLGDIVGLSFSRNNTVYKTYGRVTSVKGNTIKIRSIIAFRGYEVGQEFTYSFSKSTKTNHVFVLESVEQIVAYNADTDRVDGLYRQAADAYWTSKGI